MCLSPDVAQCCVAPPQAVWMEETRPRRIGAVYDPRWERRAVAKVVRTVFVVVHAVLHEIHREGYGFL